MTATETAPIHSERLTFTLAAAIAKVSAATIANWVKCGKLKAVRVVNRTLIERSDLMQLLEGVPVEPASKT